jgi:hypothetical protein
MGNHSLKARANSSAGSASRVESVTARTDAA